MINHAAMKLGKLPKKPDSRNLMLSRFLTPEARTAAVPNGLDLTCGKSEFTVKMNDEIGDCGPVACANMIEMVVMLSTGNRITIPDAAVLQAYMDVGGYVPGDQSTDNGVYLLDLLKYWRNTGIRDAQGHYHKILAFLEVDAGDDGLSRYVDTVFNGSLLGFALPRTAMGQKIWDFVRADGDGTPWSWGGHAACQARWRMPGMVADREAVTWGYRQPYTPAFAHHYNDERYVVLLEDMFDGQGRTFTGLDVDAVWSELAKVTA